MRIVTWAFVTVFFVSVGSAWPQSVRDPAKDREAITAIEKEWLLTRLLLEHSAQAGE